MAPAREYSSAIAKVKTTPWPHAAFSKAPGDIPVSGVAKRLAWIALGSNLGDRIGMIERACNEMSARGIKVKKTSSLWETEPMYVLEQDSFINGACEVSRGYAFLFHNYFLSMAPILFS